MSGFYREIPSYYPVPDKKGHWVSDGQLIFYSEIFAMDFVTPAWSVNDLASVPWLLRWAINPNGTHRVASAGHDYRYEKKGRLAEGNFNRHEIDVLFLEEMMIPRRNLWKGYNAEVQGKLESLRLAKYFDSDEKLTSRITADIMFIGVQLFGSSNWGNKPSSG